MTKLEAARGIVFALGLLVCFAGGALSGAAVATLAQNPEEAAVTGIGGVFFRVEDPERFSAWYQEHLGIEVGPGGATFLWWEHESPEVEGQTVWAPFPGDTDYFGPGPQAFMINFRVKNLPQLLARLEAAGVQQADTMETYPYGRFAWIVDVEGNRVELWEPPTQAPR
jgi:lactoylglutathione lyase